MTNLLPTQKRKTVHREYILRLTTIIAGFVSVAALFGVLFLLPTFFLVHSEAAAIQERHDLLQKAIAQREQDISAKEVNATKEKIAILKEEERSTAFNETTRRVIESAGVGVSLTRFFLNSADEGASELRLSGIAENREVLTAFADVLRKQDMFETIELPVSQLAKGQDIEFSITITGTF